MKQNSLGRWLIAGSLLIFACACQQKADMPAQEKQDDQMKDKSDDNNGGSCSSQAKEASEPAVQPEVLSTIQEEQEEPAVFGVVEEPSPAAEVSQAAPSGGNKSTETQAPSSQETFSTSQPESVAPAPVIPDNSVSENQSSPSNH